MLTRHSHSGWRTRRVLRGGAAVAAVLVLGCSDATQTLTGPQGQAPVATVAVGPATISVDVSEPGTLTAATLSPTGRLLEGRVVTWTSSAPDVAHVAAGVVTGLAPGTAEIVATSEGKEGRAVVTVLPPWTLYTPMRTMRVGEGRQLAAVRGDAVLPGAAWSTSDPAVATVSETGYVTAVATGVTTISARWGWSGNAPRTETITVIEPVHVVEVTPARATVAVGGAQQFSSTLRDRFEGVLTGREVIWTSSDERVATITPDGVATGRSGGSATITATSEGKRADVVLEVADAVYSVTITPDPAPVDAMVYRGWLRASVRNAQGAELSGRQIVWASLSPHIAILTGTEGPSVGVRGVAPGTARVVATSEGRADTATVIVPVHTAAAVAMHGTQWGFAFWTGCTLSQDLSTVEVWAEAMDLDFKPLPGRRVSSWSFSPEGLVTPLGPITWPTPRENSLQLRLNRVGETRVTATIDGVSNSITVSATSCTIVRLSPTSATLTVGQTLQPQVRMDPYAGGRPPELGEYTGTEWRSSDPAVATVSATGLVTARAPGEATISATAYQSTGTTTITVVAP